MKLSRYGMKIYFLSLVLLLQACDPYSSLMGDGLKEEARAANGHSIPGQEPMEAYLLKADQMISASDDPTKYTKVGATIYYIPNEKDFSGAKTSIRVRGASGRYESVPVSRAFLKALKVQGSGILSDGRTVTVYGKGSWQFTEARYGLGTKQQPLIPFRSIAIDRRQFPHLHNGDKVFIPSTKGMIIPGTRMVHDGYWIVSDVGSAIKGKRIDMFVGDMHWQQFQHYLRDPRNFSGAGAMATGEVLNIGSPSKKISIMI